MFPETLFDFVLEQLAEEVGGQNAVPIHPIQTDSFIARSIMQKAIRRGMTDLALRAAATLMVADRRVLWRRLVVTALEDLGIGEVDLTARIVAAYRNSSWRASVGGEWPVITTLINQACGGSRCQSANDLWNVAKNDPALDGFKTDLCDADMHKALALGTDPSLPIEQRGVAVLMALGEDCGPAAPIHLQADAGAIFSSFANAGRYGHVVTVYEEAYRIVGLALAPLSLCLWSNGVIEPLAKSDDTVPPVIWTGDIPTFSLDQYTRGGGVAIRRFVSESQSWRAFAEHCEIARADWAKAAGELLFRAEGAVVTNRRTWDLGHRLRERSSVLGCFMLPQAVADGMALILRELPHIDRLRASTLTTSNPANPPV